jgi:hypothetical protein
MTRICVKLRISAGAYQEILEKLMSAGYQHVLVNPDDIGSGLRMDEIAVVPEKGCPMPSHHWSCDCDGAGGDR